MQIVILDQLEFFIEAIKEPAFVKGTDERYLIVNTALTNLLHVERENILGKLDHEIDSLGSSEIRRIPLTSDHFDQYESHEVEIVHANQDNEYFITTKEYLFDQTNRPLGYLCIARNVTLQKQYQSLYEDSQAILEFIALNESLEIILHKIVNLAEKRKPNSLCSILLLDETKRHLLLGAAPSLPDFYNRAVDGIEIGEMVGSCGSAAFLKERVIVEDINTHKNWAAYLEITQRANLHSSWSQPIISTKGDVLGTFAIYGSQPSSPTPYELMLISRYAHLTSIAIEQDNNQKLLHQKELKLIEQTLEAKEQLSILFDNALVGLMYITGGRILIRGNQRLAEIFGYTSPDEMVGMSMREIHLSEERFLEFGEKFFYTLQQEENFNIEYQLKRKDGSLVWCELSGKAIDSSKPADLSKGVLWTLRDISRRKILEEQIQQRTNEIEAQNTLLQEMAHRDHLTGLYNRIKLDEALEHALKHAQRYHTIFGVLLIDIDFFKSVNDTYGHQTGDTILCEFSALITKVSREIDLIGRWGGEEFMIIISHANEHALISFAEKLRLSIEKYPFSVVSHKTASIGATLYHPNDTNTSIVARVDDALYHAKNNGRNQVSYL